MAFSNRLVLALSLFCLSLTTLASIIDISQFSGLKSTDLTTRDDGCPDDGDCDCTDWGADCDVADWSWATCDIFPDACKEPAPAVPVEGPLNCANNPGTYGGCWNDIHGGSVEACASAMYVQLPNGKMNSGSPNITQVLREGAGSSGSGGHGVTYSESYPLMLSWCVLCESQREALQHDTDQGPPKVMNIGWIPGCDLYKEMVPDNPFSYSGNTDRNYVAIIKDTYYKCTGNDGLGGYIDVGCLRYGFYPNDIDGVFASPPHPEYFWNSYPNICGN